MKKKESYISIRIKMIIRSIENRKQNRNGFRPWSNNGADRPKISIETVVMLLDIQATDLWSYSLPRQKLI